MSFVAAFCLLTSWSRTADVQVSLTKTANVATILRDLSAQAHKQLTTSDAKGKEILIVDIKNVPLDEAMQRIGWATYGTWTSDKDGFKLVRDRDAETAAERHYRDWQSREITKVIAALRKRVLEQNLAPEMTPWEREMNGRALNAPPTLMEKVLAQALGGVRPETMVYMKQDATCVYSDQPTPAQFGFKTSMAQVIRDFNAASGRSAAHILLDCSYAFEQGSAKATLFDAQGQAIDTAKATFKLYDAGDRPKELADEVPVDLDVPLSEASKFYVRPVDGWYFWPRGDVFRKAPDVVERVQNPEKYEPLATFTTDVWRAVAAWKDRNLVANVDDAYMTPVWAAKPPKLREAFRQAGGYNAELSPNWLVARPSLPTPPWQHRIDRAALGKLARKEVQDGVAMFKAIGEFSASQLVAPDPYQTTHYLAWAGAYFLMDFKLWPTARLFGSLASTQQQAILSGGAVDLSLTSDKTKRIVQEAVMADDDFGNESDLWHRPTVRFPAGLPQAGLLKGGVFDRSEIYFIRPDADGNPSWIGGYDYPTASWYIHNIQTKEPEMLKQLKVMIMPMSGISMAAILPPDSQLKGIVKIYATALPYYHEPTLWSEAPKWFRDKVLATPPAKL